MKLFKTIAIAALTVCAMTACTEKFADPVHYDSADVDFTYNVDGDQYTLDFYVVTPVKFNNISAKSGSFTWDFGDGTTSNEVSPVHKYEKAGHYEVILTLDGVGSRKYPLMIYDIAPVLSIKEQSTEIVEFNNTTLTFKLDLPNPENLPVKYIWSFPENTTYADGQPVTEFVGYADENGNVEYPAPVRFGNIGSQRVNIQTVFDVREGGENRCLEDVAMNVQVGCAEPAKTIYYAQRNGNIKALKLIDGDLGEAKIMPFDLGVASGSTVFNLLCNSMESAEGEGEGAVMQDWIYMLDAGKQYYYVNDESGVLGDGSITAFKADGSDIDVVVTNVGGPAFNDPFRGYIKDGKIYYTDRNTGFSAIDCKTRGAVESVGDSNRRGSYVMTNENTPWKGNGIEWGAISNGLYKDAQGWWYIGKYYNGLGIFRFRDSDIYESETEATKHPAPAEVLLSGAITSTFAVDEVNKRFFAYQTTPQQRFMEFPLPASEKEGLKLEDAVYSLSMDCNPENTTSEGVFVSQMAVDHETGKVYFCYRPMTTDTSGVKAGIACYDPATKTMTNYGETSDLGTGIVINFNRTKIF